MLESIRQLRAELARAPALFGTVVPELARARRNGDTLLTALFRQQSARPEAVALVSDAERVTRGELWARIERRVAWLRGRGVQAGDVVSIVGCSGIEYVALLLACSALGATAALSTSELTPAFLERALALTRPKLVLASPSAPPVRSAPCVVFGTSDFTRELEATLPERVRLLPARGRDFAAIFTSGTTGPSKLHRIGEERALFVASVFARLVHRLRPDDRVYCCLPLHHASGLLLGLGVSLLAGAPLVLRERFSARAFFDDVRRHRATVALYVGELGRALLATPPASSDREHPLRLLVGNGMSRSVWAELRARFAIPEIAEFYAATEFPGSIVNLTGKLGSVGHVPFERARGYRLIRVTDDGTIVRNASGFAEPPLAGEPGELVLRTAGAAETTERVARDVFRRGDAYVRSGDLFRRDRAGYFWFVDRLGDTFRFGGELVATRDVEDVLAAAGVRGVVIAGVRVPGYEGKACLAIVAAHELEHERFLTALAALPELARPRFLRVVPELELGESFKVRKRALAEQGVDPRALSDPLFLVTRERLEPLTPALWSAIASGSYRL